MRSTATADSVRVGYRELLRGNANFRALWFGETISMFGDWFNLIASASLVGILTQSGLAVGGLFVVRMLAPFIVSPIAGVLADRFSRKRILIVTDLARAIVVVAFLLVRRPEHIWLLYVLTAVQLGLSGFFYPARNAMVPEIVSDRELGTANALSSATWATMLALGAALGGVSSGTLGVYSTFVIDALSFLASAVLIARIHYRPASQHAVDRRSSTSPLEQYMEGLRYLRRHLDVLFIALHKGANALFITGGLNVLMVALAREPFAVGEAGGISMGLVFAATGIGTAVGPIIVRRFLGEGERALRLGLVPSYAISAVGLVIVAPLANFAMVLGGLLLRGIGGGMMWVFSTQLLMQLVPDRVRGRVFASEFAIRTLLSATGTLAIGRLVTLLGVSGTLWLTAALALVPGALWTLWVAVGRPTQEPTRA